MPLGPGKVLSWEPQNHQNFSVTLYSSSQFIIIFPFTGFLFSSPSHRIWPPQIPVPVSLSQRLTPTLSTVKITNQELIVSHDWSDFCPVFTIEPTGHGVRKVTARDPLSGVVRQLLEK